MISAALCGSAQRAVLGCRQALKHVTRSPSRTGDIARAALVLNGQWK
ncbi:hypothetical protein [Streptomyces sp. PSKA30]|nr:hypothetical protein [Streptomyces sp. PSKA30]MBZ9638753.1 hypothetical protein [Streptomyces sp. PSKA30]